MAVKFWGWDVNSDPLIPIWELFSPTVLYGESCPGLSGYVEDRISGEDTPLPDEEVSWVTSNLKLTGFKSIIWLNQYLSKLPEHPGELKMDERVRLGGKRKQVQGEQGPGEEVTRARAGRGSQEDELRS